MQRFLEFCVAYVLTALYAIAIFAFLAFPFLPYIIAIMKK